MSLFSYVLLLDIERTSRSWNVALPVLRIQWLPASNRARRSQLVEHIAILVHTSALLPYIAWSFGHHFCLLLRQAKPSQHATRVRQHTASMQTIVHMKRRILSCSVYSANLDGLLNISFCKTPENHAEKQGIAKTCSALFKSF